MRDHLPVLRSQGLATDRPAVVLGAADVSSLGDASVAEPTLSTLVTTAVRRWVPGRLYQLLHLALPLAVEWAIRGWWRPAAWAVSIAAFGAWGLADRRVLRVATRSASAHGTRLVRAIAGTIASLVPVLLLLELFLKLLGDAPGH